MSSVIFIRHGESLANVDFTWYEKPDAANILTERGVRQALDLQKIIGLHLDDDKFNCHTSVICSRFTRANLTAKIVMADGPLSKYELKEDPRLNETIHSAHLVISEKEELVIARVVSLLEQHHENLVLFTHGLLMKSLDPSKNTPLNCELRKYDRDELLLKLSGKKQKFIGF